MQIDYSYLIGNTPIQLEQIGSIKSPVLSTIFCQANGVKYQAYRTFLSTILLEPKTFYRIFVGKDGDWFDSQLEEFKRSQTVGQLIGFSKEAIQAYQAALDFFFEEQVKYSEELQLFVTYDGQKNEEGNLKPTGMVHPNVFQEVCGIIAQFNGIKGAESFADEKSPKFKNKLAEDMMAKIKKGAEELKKSQKEDDSLELPNIISAVASKHPSLNYSNIFDLTVTQLFDTFNRLCNNTSFDIHSMSVAAWGDKDNKFDFSGWYRTLHD